MIYLVLRVVEILIIQVNLRFFNVLTASMILYFQVQYIFEKHAEICSSLLEYGNSMNYHKSLKIGRKTFQLHCDTKRSIDSMLSIIPLTFVAQTFTFLVSSLAYFITSANLLSNSIMRYVLFPFAWSMVGLLVFMSFTCANATDKLEEARLTGSRVSVQDRQFESELMKQEQERLFRVVCASRTIPSTGYGLFEINRQLILQFTNATIPFIVMVITGSQLN